MSSSFAFVFLLSQLQTQLCLHQPLEGEQLEIDETTSQGKILSTAATYLHSPWSYDEKHKTLSGFNGQDLL